MTSYNINDQWQANTQTRLPMADQYTLLWLMVGQYDDIFIGTIKSFQYGVFFMGLIATQFKKLQIKKNNPFISDFKR